MFFTLFHEKPALPQGWDLRHLWAAQTMIASAITAGDKAYKTLRDPIRLCRRIRRECMAFYTKSVEDREYPMFPDEEFRDVVFAALDDYLASEAEHILSMIHSQENLDPKPLSKSLLHVLEADNEFKRFILEKAEALKRAHP
jgi:hypothetical protein